MVSKGKFLFLILFLFMAEEALLQDKNIELKQNELTDIKSEISALEEELKLKLNKEKQTFSILENYSEQNFLLNKLLNKIKAEEKAKQEKIINTQKTISSLEKDIKSLQENYAKYVVAIYKTGRVYELASLIDAGSVEQALVRYKYLKKFSEKRKEDLDLLRENKDKLIAARSILEKGKKEKAFLASQKQKEEKQLTIKLEERKKILNILKNDKAELQNEIEAKRQAEFKIKNLITKLIEDAERKKEEERLAIEKTDNKEKPALTRETITKEKKGIDYSLDLYASNLSSFASLKGRLNWPVNNGTIIRKFGENKNAQLNTVTLNYGVDIKTISDVNVKSVADGIVSAIDWIPGYGSILILTHKDNYRTVYSHLSEIFVKEGDGVIAGSVLAKVGESLEGYILHFEIWSSRNNQNPEVWLAKK